MVQAAADNGGNLEKVLYNDSFEKGTWKWLAFIYANL